MDDFVMIDVDDDFMPVDIPTEEPPKTEIVDLSSVIDNSIKEEKVIALDRLFNEDEEVIDVYEEELAKEKIKQKRKLRISNFKPKIKQKRIGRIQIGLIAFLIIAAGLIYLFGYDFFEPYIKID